MGHHRKNLRNEVLEFLGEYITHHGYPPTCDEIRLGVGLSGKSHAYYYLGALEKAGQIERIPNTPRGLRLTATAPARFDVPVVGRIAAGEPLEVILQPEHMIEITSAIADPRKNLFALEVKGDSMIDDLVADGDLIIAERRTEAARGQMAIVHLRDRNQATLKRVYQEGDRVRLQPAHPTMAAFYVGAEDVEIQGRVVAVIRRLA